MGITLNKTPEPETSFGAKIKEVAEEVLEEIRLLESRRELEKAQTPWRYSPETTNLYGLYIVGGQRSNEREIELESAPVKVETIVPTNIQNRKLRLD